MSLLLLEDYDLLIARTNFATPFIYAVALAISAGQQLSSPPVTAIGCLKLIASNNRIGNSADISAGETQVNFVLLNTGAFSVPSAVTYLQSSSGFQSLNASLTTALLPALVVNSVQTVDNSPSSSSSGLDSGAIAGIVIGGTVALFFICCAFIYVCCYRSLSKSKNPSAGEVDEQQSRMDKHSSLDEQAEAEHASEVEMNTVAEDETTV